MFRGALKPRLSLQQRSAACSVRFYRGRVVVHPKFGSRYGTERCCNLALTPSADGVLETAKKPRTSEAYRARLKQYVLEKFRPHSAKQRRIVPPPDPDEQLWQLKAGIIVERLAPVMPDLDPAF